jgi:MFS family permease
LNKSLALATRIKGLLVRKELVSIFAMIFVADTVVGIFSPTFSLYATSLGASLTLVGLLSSVVGLTRIVSSVPIGMISDARGRRGVLLTGMLLLAASAYLNTVVTEAYLLLPIRVLHGLVIASTFFIGMAYVGDVVERADRGLASGVYTTCMGLGFTVGSMLGGSMAAQYGYVTTFRAAAVLALFGFAVAWWGLSRSLRQKVTHAHALSPLGRLGLLAKEPNLLAASLGYLLIILMFDAAIVNFFPLYAATLLIGQAAIGTMFAVRALASTAVRLPTGLLTTRFSNRYLMVAALALGMVTVFSLCILTGPVALTLALAGEGICFGMYLTAGQTFVTEHFEESERGTAMGVYSMTGSISSMVGPFLLGAVADLQGLRSVFWLTSALVFVGIVAFVWLLHKGSQQDRARTLSAEGGTSAMAKS